MVGPGGPVSTNKYWVDTFKCYSLANQILSVASDWNVTLKACQIVIHVICLS